MSATEKDLRERVIDVIRDHARLNDGKVITNIRLNWTQVGYDYRLAGYSIEYKDKPQQKKQN